MVFKNTVLNNFNNNNLNYLKIGDDQHSLNDDNEVEEGGDFLDDEDLDEHTQHGMLFVMF